MSDKGYECDWDVLFYGNSRVTSQIWHGIAAIYLQGGIFMMKKILRGLLMMTAAAAVSVGASSYVADAAAITPANYTVDFTNQKINVVDTGKNTKIYVAKATVTEKKVKGSDETVMTVKTAAATEYDLTSAKATIDLSSFAVTKDVYLSVWGNVQTDPTLIKLPAAKTKMKAEVDAVNTTVKVNDVTDKKNPVEITGTEFCTTNGKWADYVPGTTKLTDYTALGATLRFRVKASANKALAAAVDIGKAADGSAVKACVGAGNFASNEIKVKIAKTANGPKATIDYNNRLVKVPNTCEYRRQDPGTALGKFTAATGDTKTVMLNADDLLTAKGGEFDIRTAATDKKPASKITEYKFDAVGAVVAQTSAGKAISVLTQDVTDSKVKDADLSVTKLVLSSKTMAGTMTVKNGTTDGYQFIVADRQDATTVAKLVLPAATDRVTGTVAAGRTASIKVKSGQYVYIRKAANVKAQQWSTPYVFYGMVSNTLG